MKTGITKTEAFMTSDGSLFNFVEAAFIHEKNTIGTTFQKCEECHGSGSTIHEYQIFVPCFSEGNTYKSVWKKKEISCTECKGLGFIPG